MTKNILIIGYGQIGKSIEGLYTGNKKYKVYHYDKAMGDVTLPQSKIHIMHICIPFDKHFIGAVIKYVYTYNPKLTIINSTVPILTTRVIYDNTGTEIAHSPVMGKHPNLTPSMLTFTKIVASYSEKGLKLATKHFNSLGIMVTQYNNPEESEIAKLLSTTYYAWNIVFMQKIHEFCEEWNLEFENVYTNTNMIYNSGYKELGEWQYTRPVLKYMGEGLGGHCLFENVELLKQSKLFPDISEPILKLGKKKK